MKSSLKTVVEYNTANVVFLQVLLLKFFQNEVGKLETLGYIG
jgi:hypothetical protein